MLDKYEMLDRLLEAGVDVADEIVRVMSDTQAEEFLGYVANMWDVDVDEENNEQ